ncbi:hypothetical protein BV25DRAFT_1904746 [Artomyces pyxidatus]|uniref:Uncharacterized protein n=1 Tax=Artomyces pyxidatus TaxID=48021 RepID=A0ACB8TIV6_9AGAM|nr:hypothetical protein BV25DRAFT_1904746 [Artomyces pyxidatus]
MSVATKNPFALLDDASRPSSPAPAPQKTEAPPASATRGAPKSKGPAARGGRYYQRGGKPRDSGDGVGEDAPAGEDAKKRFEGEGRGRGGRGRGRGDRERGRGGRGRPFDKHSMTGKTDSDKKVHQSWGGDEGNSELKAEQAGNTDAIAETTATGADADWDGAGAATDDIWNTPIVDAEATPAAEGEKEGRKPRGDRAEREPEEEDNTLTYEEYLAQREAASNIPKVEAVRAANDGADDLWKDAVQHTKKTDDEDTYFVGKSKSAPKSRAKKEEKVFIEIDARFERPSRGGGRGRGDRGGDRSSRGGERGRGRGARGGARPPRTNGSPAVNVDDESAFPSLS